MDALVGTMEGTEHREIGGLAVDVASAGNARVKRVVYPPGFRWSTHMRPQVGTEQCMHAHIGFLAQGHLAGVFPDGCTFEFTAPQVVEIEPGHDGWVVGDEPAVLIEFDQASATAERFGLPSSHRH